MARFVGNEEDHRRHSQRSRRGHEVPEQRQEGDAHIRLLQKRTGTPDRLLHAEPYDRAREGVEKGKRIGKAGLRERPVVLPEGAPGPLDEDVEGRRLGTVRIGHLNGAAHVRLEGEHTRRVQEQGRPI
jgi:hypothetical protein